ncbi:MAG: DUF362 domain-containing protein [Deltaproteobacteria bacterium]|jgi:uncharacterized Fe-S center protein|nr:DUF362 domain-containing protein [Deltaproteobacteria bacterium]
MTASKVFFTDMRCSVGVSQLNKLEKLIRKAGIEQIAFDKKYVAIKIHFGEPGNLSFLRPNYAKTVVDLVKSLGGLPFLTDCNTLYIGRRNNALVHLDAAYENGFSPLSTGCQIIIGDGLKGTDFTEVPVQGGKFIKNAKIGRAIMDADIFISLNHFKGHEVTGFGGAIKNVGMGSGSRAGKMDMHSDGKPVVNPKRCVGCRTCAKYCAQGAISFKENKASVDHALCVGCGRCMGVCNFHAINAKFESSSEKVNSKMAEYAKAVVDGRPNFHINIVNQVSPYCDCHGENDAAVVPDIGIFASFDMVALDKACIDAVNAAPVIATSVLGDKDAKAHDHFRQIHPTTDWRSQISHAEAIGLGSGSYELVSLD